MSIDIRPRRHDSETDVSLADDERDRRVETNGGIDISVVSSGDELIDDDTPHIDSQHWLDDAPDPEFRLPRMLRYLVLCCVVSIVLLLTLLSTMN
jgi:hypothetical protein